MLRRICHQILGTERIRDVCLLGIKDILEEHGVAGIDDLEKDVTAFHNPPELSPHFNILLKWRYSLVGLRLHGGDFSTPQEEGIAFITGYLFPGHRAVPSGFAGNTKMFKVEVLDAGEGHKMVLLSILT